MIVVTTPTGNIGHHVVHHLLEAGEPLRVIERYPAKMPQKVRERAEVVQGSHGDAATVDQAFAGADSVFWLAPPAPSETQDDTYLNFARPAAEAIRHCGVARVVAVTPLGRGTDWAARAGLVTASMRMIDLLNVTGAAVRSLAVPALMENALQQVDAIRRGSLVGPLDPDKKVPHIATRDIGAAAARLLAGGSWSGQKDVPLVGPEELSFSEVATIFAQMLGRDVAYRQGAIRCVQGAVDGARHERRLRARICRHDASQERGHGQRGRRLVRPDRDDDLPAMGRGAAEASGARMRRLAQAAVVGTHPPVPDDYRSPSSRRSLRVQSRSAACGSIECEAAWAGMRSAVSWLGSSSSAETSLSMR